MYKKTITFTDYNNIERTGDYYFNLTEAEVAEMEMNESQLAKDGSISGGLEEKLTTIQERGKGSEILQAFKDILFMSYGEKSEDGVRFMKSAERSRAFAETEAYSKLFMELIGDSGAAALFINSVLPVRFSQGNVDRDKPIGRHPSEASSNTVVESPAPETLRAPKPTPEEIQEYLDSLKTPKGEDGPAE